MDWIEVDDRLPDHSNEVLVHSKLYFDGGWFPVYEIGRYNFYKNEEWTVNSGKSVNVNLTHWAEIDHPETS